MTVPIFTEKRRPHSRCRQRYRWLACAAPTCASSWPQCGHTGLPSGQRCSANHASAVALSGNIWNNSMSEMPSRKALPGAFISLSGLIIRAYYTIVPEHVKCQPKEISQAPG